MLDHENKKAIDSMTTRWLEQLNSLQDKNGEDVSNINVQAEKSLVKDYLVKFSLWSFFMIPQFYLSCEFRLDTNFKACSFLYEKVDHNARSQKRIIPVPSPASIEDMRATIIENSLKLIQTESKITRLAASPNRTPFADVNSVNDDCSQKVSSSMSLHKAHHLMSNTLSGMGMM